ncbi:hypothetical protein trd_1428 [Thermomicrobium roseum DSM 5159]|uniref:Uncharacterized protein n=1 Tax=Thermomicrobium roseum (strain ATCC 27502 / DSM 5159 / P-2) TaxID=309801 RepID=B9L2M6_THERP|nr:hypothetical protein trd_1428 [Thermomicrobium roseum DSM 5159]
MEELSCGRDSHGNLLIMLHTVQRAAYRIPTVLDLCLMRRCTLTRPFIAAPLAIASSVSLSQKGSQLSSIALEHQLPRSRSPAAFRRTRSVWSLCRPSRVSRHADRCRETAADLLTRREESFRVHDESSNRLDARVEQGIRLVVENWCGGTDDRRSERCHVEGLLSGVGHSGPDGRASEVRSSVKGGRR